MTRSSRTGAASPSRYAVWHDERDATVTGTLNTSTPDAFRVHEIEWNDSQVSRLWNYYACTPPYSELYFARRFGRLLLAAAGLPPRERLEVLDFGCGPGFMWDHIRDLGANWHYTGLDFSADSVAQLAARAQAQPGFRAAQLARELPTALPDASFDVVLLIEVVEHLDDRYLDGTLREAARLLKRGGVLVVSTPNEEDLSLSRKFCPSCGAIFHEWQHVRSWSVATLRDCLAGHGFAQVKHVTTDFEARGFGTVSLVARVRRLGRRLLGMRVTRPHMLAVFQKR
jgi:SAM-dependent methyltransferase